MKIEHYSPRIIAYQIERGSVANTTTHWSISDLLASKRGYNVLQILIPSAKAESSPFGHRYGLHFAFTNDVLKVKLSDLLVYITNKSTLSAESFIISQSVEVTQSLIIEQDHNKYVAESLFKAFKTILQRDALSDPEAITALAMERQ